MDKVLIPIIIAVVSSVVTTFVTHYLTFRRDSEARQFEQKRQMYQDFMGLVCNLLMGNRQVSDEQLSEDIKKFKKEAFIWASADVLLHFYKFEQDGGSLNTVDKLFRSIREDLGHDNRKLKPKDLYKWFLKADERHKV